MQYYKFHLGDYLSNTAHLTAIEDLAYRRLLEFYYMSEQPIPDDIPTLSRRLRLDAEPIETILKEFFTLTENGWENDRCNEEITAYHAYIEKQKANGKRGGRPQKQPKKTHRFPTANPPLTQAKPTVKPTINHKPLTKTGNNAGVRARAPEYPGFSELVSNEWPLTGTPPLSMIVGKLKGAGIPDADAVAALRYYIDNPKERRYHDLSKTAFIAEAIAALHAKSKLPAFPIANGGDSAYIETTGEKYEDINQEGY